MLKLWNDTMSAVLNTDDFYILSKTSGLDELVFTISIYDENYPSILEEAIVEYEEPYIIKAIDAGADTVKVKCQIDLDDLKQDMYIGYSRKETTLYDAISNVLPSGWTCQDYAGFSDTKTIELEAATPYEIILECAELFGAALRFSPSKKQVFLYNMDVFQPMGAFASRELNLTEINYKGKSTEFATRLYAVGKDGLSLTEAADYELPYVENFDYCNKVVSAYWKDDKCEDPNVLLAEAKRMIKTMSEPVRSYECRVYDLAATNPEIYQFQDFSLFSVIRLIDDIKQISLYYQVVEYCRYPYYPEKNVVTLSTETPKIQNSVKSMKQQIEKPTSALNQRLNTAIANATGWIAGGNGGYVLLHQNESGQPDEILVMDEADISEAKHIWKWDRKGWSYSSEGYKGAYTMAASIDRGITADFITEGTLQGIKVMANTGEIGGWKLEEDGLYSDFISSDGIYYRAVIKKFLKEKGAATKVYSIQKSSDQGKTFEDIFYVDGNGDLYGKKLHGESLSGKMQTLTVEEETHLGGELFLEKGIFVGDSKGITENITIGSTTLTVKDGIITGVS